MPSHLFRQPPAPLKEIAGANPISINCPVSGETVMALAIMVGVNPVRINAPTPVSTIFYLQNKNTGRVWKDISHSAIGVNGKKNPSAPISKNLLTDTLKNTVEKFITERIKKFVTAAYVSNTICDEYYPTKTDADRIKFRIQISAMLSDFKRNGIISSYQYTTSKKDTVWGRNEWLDKNNHPKAGLFVNPRTELLSSLEFTE